MKIAVATCAVLPPRFDDDRRLIRALTAQGADAVHAVWDDPGGRWVDFDKIVIRATWDYPQGAADRLADSILRPAAGLT